MHYIPRLFHYSETLQRNLPADLQAFRDFRKRMALSDFSDFLLESKKNIKKKEDEPNILEKNALAQFRNYRMQSTFLVRALLHEAYAERLLEKGHAKELAGIIECVLEKNSHHFCDPRPENFAPDGEARKKIAALAKKMGNEKLGNVLKKISEMANRFRNAVLRKDDLTTQETHLSSHAPAALVNAINGLSSAINHA